MSQLWKVKHKDTDTLIKTRIGTQLTLIKNLSWGPCLEQDYAISESYKKQFK